LREGQRNSGTTRVAVHWGTIKGGRERRQKKAFWLKNGLLIKDLKHDSTSYAVKRNKGERRLVWEIWDAIRH